MFNKSKFDVFNYRSMSTWLLLLIISWSYYAEAQTSSLKRNSLKNDLQCEALIYSDGFIIQLATENHSQPQKLTLQSSAQQQLRKSTHNNSLSLTKLFTNKQPVFEALTKRFHAPHIQPSVAQSRAISVLPNDFNTTYIVHSPQIDAHNVDSKEAYSNLSDDEKKKRCSALTKELEELQKQPEVRFIEPNSFAKLFNDDSFFTSSSSWGQPYQDLWGLTKINAPLVWDQTEGEDIVVAVIDTGIDYNHPDLWDNIWVNPSVPDSNNDGKKTLEDLDTNQNGTIESSELLPDAIGTNIINPDNAHDPLDENGHGTHVAGTIGAVGNNGRGIVGVAPQVKLMTLQIFGRNGGATHADIAAAILKAVELGAHVTNNSYGGFGQSQLVHDAFKVSEAAGVINVAAAGNSFDNAYLYGPASFQETLTVGACTPDDTAADFSNYGNEVDICAPGGEDSNILSTMASNVSIAESRPGNEVVDPNHPSSIHSYYRISGTSMASPHVAGAVALLLSQKPDLTTQDIRGLLQYTSQPIDSDNNVGGMLDVLEAFENLDSYPVAQFSSPEIPSQYTILRGATTLTGSAFGEHFSHYILSWGEGYTPETWNEIGSFTTPVIDGNLIESFDTTFLPESVSIRLQVFDTFDRVVEDIDFFTINNFEPGEFGSSTIYKHGTTAEIRYSAYITNVESYTLEYTTVEQEDDETSWKQDAITHLNDSTFTGGYNILLGSFDSSVVQPDTFYTVRIRFRLTNNDVIEKKIRFLYFSSQIKENFPFYIEHSEHFIIDDSHHTLFYQHMDVVDLDGDNKKEIIVMTAHNGNKEQEVHEREHIPAEILVFSNEGSLIWKRSLLAGTPGFDLRLDNEFINAQFSIGDMNNDGKKEIYVPSAKIILEGQYVEGFDHLGNTLNGWPYLIPDNKFLTPETSRMHIPISADLNRDGKDELIITTTENTRSKQLTTSVYILDQNARLVTEITIPAACFAHNSYGSYTAVGNVDEDQDNELIVIGECHQLYVFDINGEILPQWPRYFGKGGIIGFPSISDMNNDGKDEIIFPRSHAEFSRGRGDSSSETAGIYVVQGNGTILPGWPRLLEPNTHYDHFNSQIVIGDLDKDGKKELVVSCTDTSCIEGNIAVYNNDGQLLEGWPISYEPDGEILTSAFTNTHHYSLVDINNDNQLDIIVSKGGISLKAFLNNTLNEIGGISAYNLDGTLIDLNPHPEVTALVRVEPNAYRFEDFEGGLPYGQAFPSVLTDLDNNGLLDIVSITKTDYHYDASPIITKGKTSVFAWEVSAPYNKENTRWASLLGDSGNSGREIIPPVVENPNKLPGEPEDPTPTPDPDPMPDPEPQPDPDPMPNPDPTPDPEPECEPGTRRVTSGNSFVCVPNGDAIISLLERISNATGTIKRVPSRCKENTRKCSKSNSRRKKRILQLKTLRSDMSALETLIQQAGDTTPTLDATLGTSFSSLTEAIEQTKNSITRFSKVAKKRFKSLKQKKKLSREFKRLKRTIITTTNNLLILFNK